MIPLLVLLALSLNACCLSPNWRGCGFRDDSTRMKGKTLREHPMPAEWEGQALAVPSSLDKDELFTKERLKAYHMLVAFIQHERPGCEIVFYKEPEYRNYERLPIRWNGYWIFVKGAA